MLDDVILLFFFFSFPSDKFYNEGFYQWQKGIWYPYKNISKRISIKNGKLLLRALRACFWVLTNLTLAGVWLHSFKALLH